MEMIMKGNGEPQEIPICGVNGCPVDSCAGNCDCFGAFGCGCNAEYNPCGCNTPGSKCFIQF